MRTFFHLTALAFLLVAAPAFAQSPSKDTKAIPSGTYTLDPEHASIVFTISHLGFSRYTGRFNKFDAKMDVDNKKPENSTLKVTIDPASIDTNHAKLQEDLKGEPWFNVPKFPQMTFTAKKIKKTGPTKGIIMGDFTMLGVTHPVTLDVTFNGWGEHPMSKKTVLGFSGKGSLKRANFGMTNGIPMVGDNVTFVIEVEFHKV